MAIVKLKLRRMSQEGFLVILTATNRDFETEGFLSPLPQELELSFNEWQSAYRQIEAVRSCIAPAPRLRLTPKSVTNHSSLERTDAVKAVKAHLNQWLNSGDSRWQPLRDSLIAIASGTGQSPISADARRLANPSLSQQRFAIANQLDRANEEIRVIIDAKDIDLRRLPWQEWSLFEEYYPHAEIALSAPRSSDNKRSPLSSNVRILVIVGRSDGINTKDDLEVIQRLGSVKPLPISRDTRSAFVAPYQGELVPPEDCPKQRNELNIKAIQNDEYPLVRRLFVIVKQDGQADEKAGEAYVELLRTDEGQKLIKEAGFIPIR